MKIPTDNKTRIVILGGGTSGWLSANAIAHAWSTENVEISLIESPDIGTVGVGEGSTPRLKIFFDQLGISESEWMPMCNATYKNGISFDGWSTRTGFERYFHPFASQLDQHTSTAFYYNCYARRHGFDVHAHPDRFFIAAKLAENSMAPHPSESFPFIVEYGYHFDANLLGKFLKTKAIERGVRHIAAKVVDVNLNDSGDISELVTDSGESIEGDFFIDCSGFRGMLIQKALGVEFVSFAENLFNDSAVAVPTKQRPEIGTQTISTAMKHGWAWEIPLTNRIGNGYVYSSSHTSPENAEIELRSHLGLLESDVNVNHIKMKVGRVKKHWHKNCLAVGLSQGFIEPLEATALNLVCDTVYDFTNTADINNLNNSSNKNSYNDRINAKFDQIRDYIVAHYILNTREDTDYWRDNAANTVISEQLRSILQIWKSGNSLSREIEQQNIQSSYTAMSWYCLLSGYGFYPSIKAGVSDNKTNMNEIDEFIRRAALNFEPHENHLII